MTPRLTLTAEHIDGTEKVCQTLSTNTEHHQVVMACSLMHAEFHACLPS